MDETDVGQLTEVFEEVRYGKRDPESREQCAIEAFRNIEAAYSDEGQDASRNAGRNDDGSEPGGR